MTLSVMLPVGFDSRPGIIGLPDRAFRAHAEAMLWSLAHLTDGRIPVKTAHLALKCQSPKRAIQELVEAGVWVVDGADYVLDWSEQKMTRDRVHALREGWKANDERKALHDKGDHTKCDRCAAKRAEKAKSDFRGIPGNSTQIPVWDPRPHSPSYSYSNSPDVVGGELENLETPGGVAGDRAHGSAAPAPVGPNTDRSKRPCVECTRRRPVSEMTQDPDTGMWTCNSNCSPPAEEAPDPAPAPKQADGADSRANEEAERARQLRALEARGVTPSSSGPPHLRVVRGAA